MLIEHLTQKFGDEVASSSDRQASVVPDVTAKNNRKVVVPEKFCNDIEALESYIGFRLECGVCITVSLSEILTICPRTRRRVDSYDSLARFLREELNVTLTIKTSKTKSYE